MYSQIPFPPGVRTVRMKEPLRCSPKAWQCGDMVADEIRENTWAVWHRSDGLVYAIFHHEPNVNGWLASEAHAKSYLNSFSPVNPFELDNIP